MALTPSSEKPLQHPFSLLGNWDIGKCRRKTTFASRFTAVGNVPQTELIGAFGIASVNVSGSRARGARRSDHFGSRSEITEDERDNGHGKTQGWS
jgi:hypothetical protein